MTTSDLFARVTASDNLLLLIVSSPSVNRNGGVAHSPGGLSVLQEAQIVDAQGIDEVLLAINRGYQNSSFVRRLVWAATRGALKWLCRM